MQFDPGVYTNKGLGGTYVRFSRLFFDILKADERYSSCITSARIPGMQTYDKAGRSSKVGSVARAVIGVGWKSSTKGIITLDNCPIQEIEIDENSDFGHITCYFPLKKPANEKKASWFSGPNYMALIRAKKTGMIRKEVVDVEIEKWKSKPIRGLEIIRNDQKLRNDLLAVCKIGLAANIKNYDSKGNFMEFGVTENKEKDFHGSVEAYVTRAYGDDFIRSRFNDLVQHLTLLLNSLFEIAGYINAEYEAT